MPAATWNLPLSRGETFRSRFNYKIDGVLQPLTGLWVPHAQVTHDSGAVMLDSAAAPPDITFTLETAGQVGRLDMRIGADRVNKLVQPFDGTSFYSWALWLVSASDATEVRQLLRGRVSWA